MVPTIQYNGSHCAIVTLNGVEVLFSYAACCAFVDNDEYAINGRFEHFSNTTARHINEFSRHQVIKPNVLLENEFYAELSAALKNGE